MWGRKWRGGGGGVGGGSQAGRILEGPGEHSPFHDWLRRPLRHQKTDQAGRDRVPYSLCFRALLDKPGSPIWATLSGSLPKVTPHPHLHPSPLMPRSQPASMNSSPPGPPTSLVVPTLDRAQEMHFKPPSAINPPSHCRQKNTMGNVP